jgi:stearoyl-CoA desaturase (delta-9 desaturase)
VVGYATAFYAIWGLPGLMWGFCVSTVFTWHGTFLVNSLAHVIGRKRYETSDASRNSWAIAILTMGEGWHNNHHHYQSAANQGWFWWEVDVTWYVLRALGAAGVVHDLRVPPASIRDAHLAPRGPAPAPAPPEREPPEIAAA